MATTVCSVYAAGHDWSYFVDAIDASYDITQAHFYRMLIIHVHITRMIFVLFIIEGIWILQEAVRYRPQW